MTRWMIKFAQKVKENTIKSRKKTKINTEVFKVDKKLENQFVFAF